MRRMSSGDNGGRRGCRDRDIMRGVFQRRMLGRRLIEENGMGDYGFHGRYKMFNDCEENRARWKEGGSWNSRCVGTYGKDRVLGIWLASVDVYIMRERTGRTLRKVCRNILEYYLY
jgi:hypothetical protein